MPQPKQSCACHKKTCPRHGNCQACQAHHHSKGSLTRCQQISRKAQNKPAP